MNMLTSWFLDLSRIGKLSVLSTVAVGTIAVAAIDPPQEPINSSTSSIVEEKQPVVTTKVKQETKPIPFIATRREEGTVAKGTTYVETPGVNGVETITHTITLTDGVETNRVSTSEVTTAPINQVTVVGTYVAPAPVTRNCDPNYPGCVPIVSYDLDCPDIGFRVTILGCESD